MIDTELNAALARADIILSCEDGAINLYADPALLGSLRNNAPIFDTFKIGWFKKIPLTWILQNIDADNPTLDITASGITIRMSNLYDEQDRRYIKTYMEEYKNWIINLYKKACALELFKAQVTQIADDVCKSIGASYNSINLYSKEKEHTTGYCDSDNKALYLDLAMMTMPYDEIYNVVAHECCHLKIAGHNDDFWKLFDTIDVYDEGASDWYPKYGYKYYNYPFGYGITGHIMGYKTFRAGKQLEFVTTFNSTITIINKSWPNSNERVKSEKQALTPVNPKF